MILKLNYNLITIKTFEQKKTCYGLLLVSSRNTKVFLRVAADLPDYVMHIDIESFLNKG